MNYLTKRFLTSFVLLFIIYLSIINLAILSILLVIINYLSLNEFIRVFKTIFKKKLVYLYLSITFVTIYLCAFTIIIWSYFNTSNNNQIISLIFLILICVLTDIGGFIFGKIFGGKKLTKISPNKTYSGMIGSFLLALSVGYVYFDFQKSVLGFEINVLLIIFFVSLASQIGDLMISFLKRKANVKDTGSILPGHGGILDRIDGILLAIPIGVILINI